jgi:hypothetical protein
MKKISTSVDFIILCPERNYGGLKSTVHSIQGSMPESSILCVVGKDASNEEIKEFSNLCPIVKSGKTYTSLMNTGLSKCKKSSEWQIIVMAGMTVRYGAIKRYDTFCTDKKQIFYQIIDRKWKFNEASIHGLCMQKQAFQEIGPFDEEEDNLQLVKLLWANQAFNKGYQLRGLVGVPR